MKQKKSCDQCLKKLKAVDGMSAKLVFDIHDLKRGLSMARLVRPSSGNFVIRFDNNRVTIYSADKRRMAMAIVLASEPADNDDGWMSDEYIIPMSKMALFDSGMEKVSFHVKDDSMVIQTTDGKKSRRATIRRRIDSIGRKTIPNLRIGAPSTVESGKFEKLLRVVGCSALVKETKTEEEMRVNQVHFDPDSETAFSNSRYHASYARLEGMKLDLSIIGSDIPAIRSFCSKAECGIGLFQDKNRLYVVDSKTGSMLVLSRVASNRPDFSLPSDEFDTEILASKDELLDGLKWAKVALDGTQRLSCEVEDGIMRMSNQGEIFSLPVSFKRGSSFKADVPSRFFLAAVNHVDSDDVVVKFGHAKLTTIIEVSDVDSDTGARHFFQIMRQR